MKAIYMSLAALFVLASCQKEISAEDTEPPGATDLSDCRLTRMVQGTGIRDTVYLFKYDDQNRVTARIDSSHHDTTLISYDANGFLASFFNLRGGTTTDFICNSKGRITSAEAPVNRVSMEYKDDTVLARVNIYEIFGGTGIYEYDSLYYDANKNLVSIKTFSGYNNSLRSITEFTYTNILNPFHSLAYLNFENNMGMDDLLPASIYDIYAGKYLLKSYRNSSGYSVEITYVVDNSKKVTGSVATYRDPGGNVSQVLTRKFQYTCK